MCLQRIIRRGIEISTLQAEQQGEQRFPLFLYSLKPCNHFNWITAGAQLPPPGTAVKQPMTTAAQTATKKTRKRLRDELDGDDANPAADAAEIARLKALVANKDARIKDLDRVNRQDDERGNRRGPREARSGEPGDVLPCQCPFAGMPNVFPAPDATPGMSTDAVAAVVAGIEVDPADAVNSQAVSEVVAKHNRGDTITAEFIHSLTCPADKKAVMTVDNDMTGGGFTMSSSTASTRKLDQMHQLFTVEVLAVGAPEHEVEVSDHPRRRCGCRTCTRGPRLPLAGSTSADTASPPLT